MAKHCERPYLTSAGAVLLFLIAAGCDLHPETPVLDGSPTCSDEDCEPQGDNHGEDEDQSNT